jgi:hypothetical protein
MVYFLSWPVQELFKKAMVRCAIANSEIFAKTFNIFIRGRYLYQWYYYNHNAKRYENVIRGIINWTFGGPKWNHYNTCILIYNYTLHQFYREVVRGTGQNFRRGPLWRYKFFPEALWRHKIFREVPWHHNCKTGEAVFYTSYSTHTVLSGTDAARIYILS